MKRLCYIGILLVGLVLAMACNPKGSALEPAGVPSRALSAIDSLMWRQPDSAFAQLLQLAETTDTDSFDAFDRHYFQLLVAELLYKNDCSQSNRTELRQAVGYFDSLAAIRPPFKGARGIQKTISFLDARAHYINGVGYYENDSVVEACSEYLKALEVMEEHFEEKELVGKRAQFMAYTYNRLGDLFYDQLQSESAICCYNQALHYCKITPTSKYGTPVLLYNIGIQFDILGQKDSASFYYDNALANMPDFENLHYRDILVNKSILDYNLGVCEDSVVKNLKHVISLAPDDEEKLTRFLTLGNLYFYIRQYDSSRKYLKPVFKTKEDIPSKVVAAQNLYDICQMQGDSISARQYESFLASYTITEIEIKKDVSKINEMFKEHVNKKQKKEAEKTRWKSVNQTIRIIIPIAIAVVLAVVALLKLRNKKNLETQRNNTEMMLENKERIHRQEMEVERQNHSMKQAALSGRLKRSNQELRELKKQISQRNEMPAKAESVVSFIDEPVCRLIMERVKEGMFKAKIDCKLYQQYALDKQQLLDLRAAADRHFSLFTLRLRKTYPELTNTDIDYCCLYLLNLTYADISALLQRAYNTVVERDSRIRKIIGGDKALPVTLMDIAKSYSSV